METLTVRNVRCFRGEVNVPLSQVTVLVGENSTGKTTLLSMLRVAWDITRFWHPDVDFNEPPFQFGSYRDLAHYHGGQGKRAPSFDVGFTATTKRGASIGVRGTFEDSKDQPMLSAVKYHVGGSELRSKFAKGRPVLEFVTEGRSYSVRPATDLGFDVLGSPGGSWLIQMLGFPDPVFNQFFKAEDGEIPPNELRKSIVEGLRPLLGGGLGSASTTFLGEPRPIALAPIRTEPRRTYDPLKEHRDAGGSHVPMVLSRISTESKSWRRLSEPLSEFGLSAGLFEHISVRSFKHRGGSPFQLVVGIPGQRQKTNILDVGYGVSQCLPLVVECLMAETPTTFLVQQPEVHLHPRAQAALATFVAEMTKERKHRFVVETHSDYFLDRLRLTIRNHELDKDALGIVYLERCGNSVECSEIRVDGDGNICGAPKGYRSFFLKEESRLLGLEVEE